MAAFRSVHVTHQDMVVWPIGTSMSCRTIQFMVSVGKMRWIMRGGQPLDYPPRRSGNSLPVVGVKRSTTRGAMTGQRVAMLTSDPTRVNATAQAAARFAHFPSVIRSRVCVIWRAICSSGFRTSGMRTTTGRRWMVQHGVPMKIVRMRPELESVAVGGTIRGLLTCEPHIVDLHPPVAQPFTMDSEWPAPSRSEMACPTFYTAKKKP